jgi:glycosyltransferase involved in cell wall biosynthesis
LKRSFFTVQLVGSPRERIRILFLVSSMRGGGAERVIATLLEHIDRLRFEPHLGLVKAEGPYLNNVPEDVYLHDLKAVRARYALPGIVRLAWRVRPQIIFSTAGQVNLALILGKGLLPPRLRLLVRETTVVSCQLSDTPHPRAFLWLFRHLYRRADRVICPCDYSLVDLAKHFGVPRARLERIYNPVDSERIERLAMGESPYTSAGPNLIAVGRLSKEKRLHLLIEAIPHVRRVLPTAELTILGAGPLEAELKNQCRRLRLDQVIHWLGFQENPYAYLRAADLFVLVSRYEGLPNSLLEALALGTPSLAVDSPSGIREIAETGCRLTLIPSGDAKALAAGVIRALEQPKGSCLPKPAFYHRFGVQSVVSKYQDLFCEVLDGCAA